MALSEFALIDRRFARCGASRDDVLLGVGDDAALLSPPPGKRLAVSVDTLVEGVHFFADTDLVDLGWKALAVNLSDLAAMGAAPAWAFLALTLPDGDEGRVDRLAAGLCPLARNHGVQLAGGDTTRGPFSITIQVHGFVEEARAMRRDAARPGDGIHVTGHLGDAALALRALYAQRAGRPPLLAGDRLGELLPRLHRPEARIDEGMCIARHARCALDISDGLMADLGHICARSGVGARIEVARLPLSNPLREYVAAHGDWSPALTGGEDYELCFTLPPEREAALRAVYPASLAPFRRIGEIVAGEGVECILPDGRRFEGGGGYDHFT